MAKQTASDTPSAANMRDALLRSGYLLEQRVEALLGGRHSAYVEANSAYPDEFSGKSREFDIFALTAYDLDPSSEGRDFLFTALLCECENNSQPVVFFTKPSVVPFLEPNHLKVAGLPQKIQRVQDGRWQRLSEFLGLERFHHYASEWISSQYCSFQRRKSDDQWIALHHDEHHDTLTGLASAVEWHLSDYYSGWNISKSPRGINLQLHYPILVLQGELYEAQVDGPKLKLKKARHVLFRKDYHSANRHNTYIIDVVQESYLPKFLDMIEEETEGMAKLMKRQKCREALLNASQALVVEARDRPTEDLRAVFEYRS